MDLFKVKIRLFGFFPIFSHWFFLEWDSNEATADAAAAAAAAAACDSSNTVVTR